MKQTNKATKYKQTIGSKLSSRQELHQYEESFRRWLGREIHEGRYTTKRAMDELGLDSRTLHHLLKVYHPDVSVPLALMSESEKKELQAMQQRLKDLEKQLEDARIKNIALETLVDVAEKELNISIRKKPGAKQ